ncbi:MAG: hypothetical protein AAFZ04_05925 [Pseudomonadota bacterium]
MTDTAKRIGLACVLFAAKIVFLGLLAVNTQLVMDEFWQFGQTKYLWNGFYDTIWPVKSVGYALWYAPAHWAGLDAASTVLAGRVWAFCTVLMTLGVIAGIGRRLGYSWLAILTILMLLLSVSTYMERSFRLRSETPAILFAALSLWVVLRDGLPSLRSVLIAGALTGCAFLCTQKAIYFNFALGLALVVVMWRGTGLLAGLRTGAVLIAGWLGAIAAYSVLMGGTDALQVARQIFVGPAELATTGGSLYEGLRQFIIQTLMRNLPLYVIFGTGLVLALAQFRTGPPARLIAAMFTAVLTALIFAHNQPWPYIFAMCLPFLALWAPVLWDRIVAAAPARQKMAPIVVGLLVAMTFPRNVDYLDHSNAEQLDVIRTAEAILGEDGTYFDGIGMLPTAYDTPRRWLDAPGIRRVEQNPDSLMKALRDTPPDLILETYRTDNLPDWFSDWVARHYVAIAPGFLVPGAQLTEDSTEVTILREMTFDLAADEDTQVTRDGDPVPLPLTLSPGRYTVSATRPAPLIPQGVTPPARQTPRAPLFSQIYTR